MEASGTQKRLTVREEMDYLQKTIGKLNKEVELLAERLSWIMEMSVESKKVKSGPPIDEALTLVSELRYNQSEIARIINKIKGLRSRLLI